MKKFFASLFLTAGFIVASHGQGTVLFQNTSTTTVTNIITGLRITGADSCRFGLYVGAAGDPNPSTLLATTTNLFIVPGVFVGGNVSIPASAGTTLAFQVRGWSDFGYATFEQAYAVALTPGGPDVRVGWSAVGSFVVPASGSVSIFGTGPGQVGGFYMVPVIPEPSTYALAALALACWLVRRSVRRSPVSKLAVA